MRSTGGRRGNTAGVVGLPGIRGSVDRFGRHRVTTTWARAASSSGGGSGGGSGRVAMVPSVGRHTPGTKARRKASETQVRRGVLACNTWIGSEKKISKI